MSYCVDLTDFKFVIHSPKVSPALNALRANARHLIEQDRIWNYVDMEAVVNASTLCEALSEIGYSCEVDTNGDVLLVGMERVRLGNDYGCFTVIAPYVENGSFLEYLGEDGERWRWVFKNGVVEELTPTISWGTTIPLDTVVNARDVLSSIKSDDVCHLSTWEKLKDAVALLNEALIAGKEENE